MNLSERRSGLTKKTIEHTPERWTLALKTIEVRDTLGPMKLGVLKSCVASVKEPILTSFTFSDNEHFAPSSSVLS